MKKKRVFEFDGRLRISGTVAEIERALGVLQEHKGVTIEGPDWGPDPVRPFPPVGIIDDLKIASVINTGSFAKKKLKELNGRLPKAERVAVKFRPGHLINGGRKYYHLHVGDEVVELNERLFNSMVTGAVEELGRLGAAGRI